MREKKRNEFFYIPHCNNKMKRKKSSVQFSLRKLWKERKTEKSQDAHQWFHLVSLVTFLVKFRFIYFFRFFFLYFRRPFHSTVYFKFYHFVVFFFLLLSHYFHSDFIKLFFFLSSKYSKYQRKYLLVSNQNNVVSIAFIIFGFVLFVNFFFLSFFENF